MNSNKLQADYLVIGSGAMAMAFTDVLMTETDATVIMVDRHHQPGGHWNDAYPFVRLHQPSSFYGVNSKKLGSDTVDATGWNKGLYELATNSEVCAYFDQVMQQQFLPSGRVQYFPMCEYQGNREFQSLVSDKAYRVEADKIVDATYMNVTVPSMRDPSYTVDEGASCVAPNLLPRVSGQYDRYVIVGAGKTGMDACLFLLRNEVDPDRISWIMPRDSWLLDRANIQPWGLLSHSIGDGFALQMEAIAQADSVEDLFHRVNACGQLLRLDEDVWPTMYRCATVTQAELEQLRRIKDIVRMGHVKSIGKDSILLDEGTMVTSPTTLHVDCSADGLERRPVEPVFNGEKITLQSVRTCQQVFSAAFLGHLEAAYDDEALKNELSTPVPHPDSDIDFLRTTLANSLNSARWSEDADLQVWLRNARLDAFSTSIGEVETGVLEKIVLNAMGAVQNLQKMLSEIDG
jgi:hypothetical protein